MPTLCPIKLGLIIDRLKFGFSRSPSHQTPTHSTKGSQHKIKNEKIWEKFPNGGGGKIFFQKSPNFNLGTSKIQGGSQFFKNVPISIIYKKCLKFKNVPI